MEEGPLPPHERAWRHPSELGPPVHEPTSRTGRVLIVSTATLGLLLVGILAVTMTPRRSVAPVAANSTAVGSLTRPPATGNELPLVTPVGGDGWAITTVDALAGVRGPTVRVRLSTGGTTVVKIMRSIDDVTVVSLPTGTDAVAFDVASSGPSGDDTIVLHVQDAPISVPMGELANAEVAEATPVLDDRGRLVGLATGKPDARWMIPVDTAPAAPTSTTPTSTTTTVAARSTTSTPTTTTTTTTTTSTTAAQQPATTVGATTTVAPSTAPPSGPTTVSSSAPQTPETPETPATVAPTTARPTVPPGAAAPSLPPPSPPSGPPTGGTGGGDEAG